MQLWTVWEHHWCLFRIMNCTPSLAISFANNACEEDWNIPKTYKESSHKLEYQLHPCAYLYTFITLPTVVTVQSRANWDLFSGESNLIASSCKIHNDASCDISSDGKLLATFVPSTQGFPDDGVVAVYSLEKTTLGHCVFSKKFGEIFNFSSIFSNTIRRLVWLGFILIERSGFERRWKHSPSRSALQ